MDIFYIIFYILRNRKMLVQLSDFKIHMCSNEIMLQILDKSKNCSENLKVVYHQGQDGNPFS